MCERIIEHNRCTINIHFFLLFHKAENSALCLVLLKAICFTDVSYYIMFFIAQYIPASLVKCSISPQLPVMRLELKIQSNMRWKGFAPLVKP